MFQPYIKAYLTYLPTPKRGVPKTYISRLLNSDQKTLEIDTEQLKTSDSQKFYMACFQAARRSRVCKAKKDGVKVILERI